MAVDGICIASVHIMVRIAAFRFSEGADYRHALLAFAAGVVLLVAATCASAQSAEFASEVEERVVTLTNDVRAKNGAQPLQAESRLADAARSFAAYIAGAGRLDHDADGTTPAERVKKRGYAYCIVAENLGMEYSSGGFTPERLSKNFIDGWMESPTHRGNILEPDITQIGVGVSRNKAGEYYAVQVFARPLAQMTRFRIFNRANATVRYEYRKRGVTLGPRQGRNHESCVAGTVKLDSSGQEVSLQPKDGGRYAITQTAQGVYRIAEE
jgi:uncharacterized protein YkwD